MRVQKILIADDHAVLREGLTMLLNTQPDMQVVGHANDGRTLVQRVQECLAEVVILDVSMPGGGAVAAAQLREALPNVRVIALTRHSEPGYVRQLLQAGASGYVLKHAGADELLDAIRVVAGGGTYLDSTLSARVTEAFVRAQSDAGVQAEADLSGREVEVVRLLAQGYTNKEIAAQLGVSVKTTETYKARAMEKLGLYSRAALVRYALQRGWLDQG
jgi:DNA-binding NarL/FixJ family response regulator